MNHPEGIYVKIVVTCLGEPDGEKGQLKQGGQGLDFDGVLHIDQLVKYFS